MAFDSCEHRITQLILRVGELRRKEQGLPPENNITVLYDETMGWLGMVPKRMTSGQVDHLPSPSEITKDDGKFIIPRRACPKCGTAQSLVLVSLCPSCEASEGGKYHSAWRCMTKDCGYMEKSNKFLTQVLTDLGIEFQTGSKKDMGIKTITDDGVK